MPGHDEASKGSRQLLLAAQPQIFLRLKFGHPQQMAEHLEPVASRQPDQIGRIFRDEGCGFVRPTLPARFVVSRTAPLARRCALAASLCFAQMILLR